MNKKLLAIVSIVTVLSCTCDKNEFKIIDFNKFTMEVPSCWRKKKLWIEDSYIGGVVMDADDMAVFDLGWYGNTLDVDTASYNIEWLEIDGRKAKLVRPKISGHGFTGIYIDNLWKVTSSAEMRSIDSFQMSATDLKPGNEELLVKAFQTLKFER